MSHDLSAAPDRCQVAILAGGAGTRLKSRTGTLPKPMALILGQPVLAHLLALCRAQGYCRIALLVHYEHEAIQRHFGDGSNFGVHLHYVVEHEARGTAGALLDALPSMEERFLVLYGDTFVDADLRRFWQRHAVSGASASLFLHPNDHPHDSDLVEADDDGRVVAIHPYPHDPQRAHANLVNAALYVMQRDQIERYLPKEGKADLAKHSFPSMLRAGCHLQAYVSPEYVKDMGTPERLDKVEQDLVNGLPERMSSRQLRAAVFIDRDGTLNEEVGHLSQASQMRLIPGSAAAVRALNRAGRLAICVTNQPVVARGDVSPEGLRLVHAKLDHLLGLEGAYLDRLYHCPHHPERGFVGEVPALKVACDCRKPGTGMFDRAVRELEIQRAASWMVGDTSSDIRAGCRAGLRTVLVRTGHGGRDRKYPRDQPGFVAADLAAAVDWILSGHRALTRQLWPLAATAIETEPRFLLIAGPARAGKSTIAQVLSELIRQSGRTVHIICADDWMVPLSQRAEGREVLARYDLDRLWHWLAPLLRDSCERHWLQVPGYDCDSRQPSTDAAFSVGPGDLIILEGLPVLMHAQLRQAAAMRVFVDCAPGVRQQRLQADCAARVPLDQDLSTRLSSREADELPVVQDSAAHASHCLDNSGNSRGSP